MGAQVVAELEQVQAPGPSFAPAAAGAGIELYWLPLGGWLVRQAERAHLGGHPGPPGAPPAAGPLPHRPGPGPGGPVRGRELLAHPQRRRPIPSRAGGRPGGQPAAGALAGVLLRGAVLAGGGDRRRRRGGGQPPVPQRRSRGRPSPAGVGRVPAGPGVGSGRAGDGRAVEFQLGDRLAAGPQRSPNRIDPASGRWAGAGLVGRPDRGQPLAKRHRRRRDGPPLVNSSGA